MTISAKLKKLQATADRATAALVAELNREYPVGAPVWIEWGRGFMRGTVAFPCDGEEIPVRSETGRVHRRHYSAVFTRISTRDA